MREILHRIRKQYGNVYVTIFSEELIVPWTTLSIEDYIKYNRQQQFNILSSSEQEEEIFRKYVLDQDLVNAIEYLQAGIVSTVVSNIWISSFPMQLDIIASDMDLLRNEFQAKDTKIYHEMISLILLAFPYKPEEVYAMNYDTLMTRFAQAEEKLLRQGILQEHVEFVHPQHNAKKDKMERKSKAKEYLEQRFANKKKQNLIEHDIPITNAEQQGNIRIGKFEHTKKWWKESPILEVDAKHQEIIHSKRSKGIPEELQQTAWEIQDKDMEQYKLAERAKIIYKDVLTKLDSKKKSSTIKK
jgi:hypothetical protein